MGHLEKNRGQAFPFSQKGIGIERMDWPWRSQLNLVSLKAQFFWLIQQTFAYPAQKNVKKRTLGKRFNQNL